MVALLHGCMNRLFIPYMPLDFLNIFLAMPSEEGR